MSDPLYKEIREAAVKKARTIHPVHAQNILTAEELLEQAHARYSETNEDLPLTDVKETY